MTPRPRPLLAVPVLVLLLVAGCGEGSTTAADVEVLVRDQLRDPEDPNGHQVHREGVALDTVDVDCEPTTFWTDVGSTIDCTGALTYADGRRREVPVAVDLRSDGLWPRIVEAH
jgi:hypothetical protein